MMPCLSLQAAATVSETEARSCHHKWEKHSQDLLQLSHRTQTQHFQSSQEATEYDFNSILCVFLHPTEKQMQSAKLQLLRKIHLGHHDRVCAQISLQQDSSLARFCTRWHLVAKLPAMRLGHMAGVPGNNVIGDSLHIPAFSSPEIVTVHFPPHPSCCQGSSQLRPAFTEEESLLL